MLAATALAVWTYLCWGAHVGLPRRSTASRAAGVGMATGVAGFPVLALLFWALGPYG